MWGFSKKKQTKRKVFGFLCDPRLAEGLRLASVKGLNRGMSGDGEVERISNVWYNKGSYERLSKGG